MVKGSGIDYRLRGFVGAEHDEQVGDHRRLALLVQFDDMFAAQTLQGHVDHRHGALDDLFAGRNNGVGLLTAQHHGGDFGSIGQIVDAGFDHLDAGHRQAFVGAGR